MPATSPPFPTLSSRAVLSPMAGVTDVAFRALARQYGAAMTYTEFVSSTAVVRGSTSTKKLLATDPSEHPVGVQLFGSSEDDVVAAAKAVSADFDVIDINCGCPAWKVIKTGAGSQMLSDPARIARFIKRLCESVDVPVTVKIRKGIDEGSVNAVQVAQLAESAGASAIAIHGRTQKQGYSGTADWDIIRQVKQAVKIPVIGNGDVFTPEDFKRRLEESGVDYIMIARGAIGNPAIFAQIKEYMLTGTYKEYDRITQFFAYLELALRHNLSFTTIKLQAVTFTKGIPGGARLRERLAQAKTVDEITAILRASQNK